MEVIHVNYPVCQHLSFSCIGIQVDIQVRFRWSLFKTLEFMQSRVQNLSFDQDHFETLKLLEMELLKEEVKLTYNWKQKPSDLQELILRNTHLNSQGNQDPLKMAQKNFGLKKSTKRQKRVSFMVHS